MRIALVAHHTAPIAPPFVGGVESHTWYLARWLARRGHDVTLFALPGSAVPGVRTRPLDVDAARFSAAARADVASMPDAFITAHHAYLQLMVELGHSCPFDVVHLNTLHYLPVAMAQTLPVRPLLTLHCPPTPWLESALATAGTRLPLPVRVAAVSEALTASWSHVVRVDDVVLNGVDLQRWRRGDGGSGAVWAGRIVPEKAPHLAIDAARLAGLPIALAGPIIDRPYWEREVEPRLGDDAHYLGHLDHDALATLVGASRVSVQSPAWDEPFGLSAAESIACATPVAAFARGGLGEVVGPASGVLAARDDVHDLARAIREAAALDRGSVRADAERRLGVGAMGRGYEAIYRSSLAPAATPTASAALRHSRRVHLDRARVGEASPAAA